MRRLFLPSIGPGEIKITGEKAHYLFTVLRCKKGEELILFDSRGASYRTAIKAMSKKEVLVEVVGDVPSDTESPLNIILIQGLLKGEKMDLVVQKTTELGLKEIVPTVTERSQVRETRKVERWKRIAEDASRQCGRTDIPLIHETVSFADVFSHLSALGLRLEERKGLLFWEEGGTGLSKALERLTGAGPLLIAVGPEGGFAREEVRLAEAQGFLTTTLGSRILRSETAAIAATAIVQFFLGDLG